MSIFNSFLHLISGRKSALAQADSIVGTIIGLMHEAEGLYPNGADKLEHVRLQLESAWHKFDSIAVSFETAWPVISSLIATLVSLYTASGAFKRKAI